MFYLHAKCKCSATRDNTLLNNQDICLKFVEINIQKGMVIITCIKKSL